jgi:hypothetical protein
MAIRPEDLPSDPARLGSARLGSARLGSARLGSARLGSARLVELVLSLDAENDRLRAVIGTFKDMVFGSRSEKLAAVVADQLALDLADLATDVTLPAAANDDHVLRCVAADRQSIPSGRWRKSCASVIEGVPVDHYKMHGRPYCEGAVGTTVISTAVFRRFWSHRLAADCQRLSQ